MAIQHPDIQPAVNHSVQVAIAGAGPVGLMMANYLGQMGIDVLVVEKLDKLIDYPRAIGIDDEALRTMQSVGLFAGGALGGVRVRGLMTVPPISPFPGGNRPHFDRMSELFVDIAYEFQSEEITCHHCYADEKSVQKYMFVHQIHLAVHERFDDMHR